MYNKMWIVMILTLCLILGQLGITGYAIYQLFQGEYMAAIAAALIVLVLKQFNSDWTNLLDVVSKTLRAMERGRFSYYDEEDEEDEDDWEDEDDEEMVVSPPPRNVRNIKGYQKKNKK